MGVVGGADVESANQRPPFSLHCVAIGSTVCGKLQFWGGAPDHCGGGGGLTALTASHTQ